ncbi:MAG: 8-oxoguanine deaminase [Elusimicrobia bacterium RIFCSPHIGHO2_02_FULL_57_9]|nr:MAG: 8-oxoguanine deaminase [Elusimicrobia bacterium RIFCSPHIGHO2_02_FULL_57_9]
MKPPILIKNALRVALMDDARTELSDADVLIKGRVILAAGHGLEDDSAQVLDARGCVVVPGFINTHHHLCQALTRNIAAVQDAKLFDWLSYLYTVWRHLTPEAAGMGALVGLSELLLTGCTTSSDHTYLFPLGRSAELIDRQIEAARKLGMRFHPTRGSMSVGASHGGLPPDDVTQDEEEILRDAERLVKTYHDPGPYSMCRIGLAPCAPFSVSPELMKTSAAQAKRWGVRLHTHLAETLDEEIYCLERYQLRPLDFIESVGWLEGNAWFAHMVHLKPEEVRRLAAAKTGVSHCPSSNLRLGSGIAPVRDYLDAGVAVGLGVDGSASNDSGDMLGELRQCLLVHRARSGVKSMPARDVLWMATRGGAKLLGRDDIGRIGPGQAADLAIFDLNKVDYAGSLSDPVTALLFCGLSHRSKWTIVNGKVVVENGRLVNADEQEITEQANKTARELLEKARR